MEFCAKSFGELSTDELYEILKVRAQVFIVEQKINCLDLDGVDKQSIHCYIKENGKITAYLRAFEKEKGTVKIGRVLSVKRNSGYGRKIMECALAEIKVRFGAERVIVDAQKHACGFYEKSGFEVVSGDFLEEGVVHVAMVKKL